MDQFAIYPETICEGIVGTCRRTERRQLRGTAQNRRGNVLEATPSARRVLAASLREALPACFSPYDLRRKPHPLLTDY
jgi:hypothetical protein